VADEIAGIFGVVQDITEQKRHSRELKESEQKWQHLVEDNPQPVQVTVDGKIVFINEAGAILYGARSPRELMQRSVFDFSHPDLVKRIEERKHHLENGLPVDRIHEHKIIRLDGNERFVEVHSIPIQYQGKKAIQTVLHDVTDRKEKEQIIESSLAEKEVLLQEIHHRVKNNLAVISGLVELQAMSSENLEVKEVLKESQLRIQSMAMIHEKLYQTETFTNIEFRDYIQELVNSISVTFDFTEKNIAVTYRMESVRLNINQAIPCALILNELIVNCYKHAFANEQEGNVKITLQREGKVLELTVADDGVGLPRGFSMENQQSLGMTLVQTLTEQLQGELTLDKGLQGRGSSFSIRFEKP
jgi:PAS domain S-box-containing protein